MFDPIAPATSVGRPTPPTVAFGTSAEEDDGLFDHLLRENDRAEEPEPNRPAERRDHADDETRAAERPNDPPPRETVASEDKPVETKAKDGEQTTTERDDAAPSQDDAKPKETAATEPEAASADSASVTPQAAQAAAAAKIAAANAANAPVAASQVAVAAAAPTPRASAAGQANAAAPSAVADTNAELPTLQSLQNGRNLAGQDSASRQQQGEARLPEALQQLLQRSTGMATASTNASATTTANNSFRAALESTALTTTVKPDAGNAAPNPAALPTAAAAPVTPATAAAPLPSVDPLNPLSAQTGSQTVDASSGTLKSTATLGATAGRAAAPATTPSLQIAMHIARAAQDGTNKLSVRLDPAELGRVEVRLEVGHDGRVQALVSAERQETLDMLQRDARDLARALKDAGLSADSNDLNFSLRDDGGQETLADKGAGKGDGRDANGDQPMADEPNAGGMADAEPDQPRPQIAGSGALDIVV